MPSIDFDIESLYHALDAERQAAHKSWKQLAEAINYQFEGPQLHPISLSTLSGMRKRQTMEGDGVLMMLRWLRRTPESFVPGCEEAGNQGAALPEVPRNRMLRFDCPAIYAALDALRTERKMTWKQVASEIGGLNAPGLTRLAKGGRTGFPQIIRISRWLGLPVASLTRIVNF